MPPKAEHGAGASAAVADEKEKNLGISRYPGRESPSRTGRRTSTVVEEHPFEELAREDISPTVCSYARLRAMRSLLISATGSAAAGLLSATH